MGSGGRVIGYLGPETPHFDAFRTVAGAFGNQVVYLPDSSAAGCYRGRWLGKSRRWAAQLVGTRDRRYVRETLAVIDRERVDVVLAYWGTLPLPDVQAIRLARPDLPCVLVALCHPIGLTDHRVRVQNWSIRRAARFLSGVVYPSARMADYFAAEVFRGAGPPGVVVRPCWPGDWHADGADPPVETTPAVVFLGRADSWQPCDNVHEFLGQVARQGVHVWHVADRGSPGAGPFRHPFPPDTLEGVIRFASRFDAALVCYNTAACARTERFENTVPDRLVSAVAAGVPVALPRGYYKACREYLADYPAVIDYDTPEELAAALRDRGRVSELRAAGRAARNWYRAEDGWPKLVAFLDAVAAAGARRVS